MIRSGQAAGYYQRLFHWRLTTTQSFHRAAFPGLHRNSEGKRKRGSDKTVHLGPFFRQTSLDELPLELRQFGLEQPAVAADVVAVRPQESEVLIDHCRHPFARRLST